MKYSTPKPPRENFACQADVGLSLGTSQTHGTPEPQGNGQRKCAATTSSVGAFGNGVCPVCTGALIEIRGKLQCRVCHTICETCCEGGRQ